MTEQYSYQDFRSRQSLLADEVKDDVFFVSAGFEPRATAAVNALSSRYEARLGIVYVNKELRSEYGVKRTEENLEWLRHELDNHCDEVRVAEGSWLSPSTQIKSLGQTASEFITDSHSPLRVSVDSTCFSKETLLILLNLIYSRDGANCINIFYVSPKTHGEWLSRGHRQIRNILGQAGIHQANRPTSLILLSGFEKDRAERIIEEFEASEVLLGIGDPPTNPDFLERNEEEQDMILAKPEIDTFNFPAGSIDGTRDVIQELIRERLPDKNIVVAPQSTKLSTIGAWKASRHHFEIQMTYSVPGEYNYESYSDGVQDIYIDKISDFEL